MSNSIAIFKLFERTQAKIVNRKPLFQNPEPIKTDFSQLVDAEFQAARAKDPNIKYEKVLAETAKRHPELYQLHGRKVGGDQYAASSITTDPSPYFRKVSDIYFSELRRVNPEATYPEAAAACADCYPALYEKHLAEKVGLPVIQSRVQLSDRKNTPARMGKGVTLDRLSFARRAFPRLVADRLNELKAEDTKARYETALSETSIRFSELYADYVLSLSA